MALVYSCCFWFSLRLGGIMIAIFSTFQALILLIACCIGYANTDIVKNEINAWTSNYDVIYAKTYFDSIEEDPLKHLSLGISFNCIYIATSLLYIYGAYTFNNILMASFIVMEFLRLLLISALVTTTLLLIKQNAMDIGLLIGTSVAGGFLLLGMFYLWICAVNLPIVINETKNEDQTNMINKLKQLLDINNQSTLTRKIDTIPFTASSSDYVNKNLFIVSNNDLRFQKRQKYHSKIN